MSNFADGFAGKVALVTGGASGIGLATAKKLRGAGATVVVADVDEARGKAESEAIGAEFARLDVSDSAQWEEVVSGVVQRHGGLDIAFLNAGVTTFPATGEEFMSMFDISEVTDAAYRRIMGVNVDGVVLGTRAVASVIAAQGGGAIVATASAAGVIAFAPDAVYTMTKHAVVGFVRAMGPSLAEKNITINAVLPGAVDTNILAPGFAEQARDMGVAMIDASEIADGVINAIHQGTTSQLWLCLANQAPFAYEFAPVDGLGITSGAEA
ncbi:MAG: SDR family oxidoreductase [Proteobacteria bacterium]|nr:SDR family oxidoreductase [Pseudomonadota bacterium]